MTDRAAITPSEPSAPEQETPPRVEPRPIEPGLGFEKWMGFLSSFVAPLTLVTALLFYFGYVSTREFFRYFGVDVDIIGLSSQEFVMRSPGALFIPVMVLTLLAAGMLRKEPGGRVSREGLLGLAYLVGAAGTLMVGTRITQEAHDIQAILFGTGVLVRPSDTTWVLTIAAVLIALMLWWRRGLLFASFDPDGARVRGLPVAFLGGFLLVAIALSVSVTTRALGALPVFAFSVLPALAAVAMASSPTAALVLATVIGLVAGAGGYLLAFFAQFPVGASQTFVAALAVVVGLCVGALARR